MRNQEIIRAKSGTPAFPNHRRPSTFSDACLSCGRTLLAALTVLSAVLQSIFAAFTIVLLVSLLTVTAEGQGVTATLPETMTEDSVIDFVTEQQILTVEAFIQALPPLHKRHFVAVHDSASPATDFISTSHPRIISWGADASFVVTWTTNPGDPESDNVEFLQPVPAEGRWIAGVIDFSGDSPQLRHPAACAQCHGDLRKPLWGADDVHDGTEGETLSRTLSEDAVALHQAMSASTHPRLTPLELNRYQSAPRTIGFANRESQIPTWEFALVLALRHSEVLFNRLRVRQDYDQLSGSLVCSSSITDLERKIRSEFDQADYNIRLLSDTLEPVQGENSLTVIKAGEYKGGDVTLSLAIGFLIFHDLWQRLESVRDLYRGTSNEHALGTIGFAPGFREMLLRYPIGQATVEDELVAAYDEFFELRGQASIDERALRPINPRYGADFTDAHVAHFHDRVCSALSPPPPRPPPPGGGGGGGGGGLLFPPRAPAALTAMPGDGAVRLEWSPPESDGGTPVLRYEYRLKDGREEFGEWTPIEDSAPDEVNASGYAVGELGNGTVYVFELRAVNAAGSGPASEAVEVRMPLDPAYGSNFRAEDLEGESLMLEAFFSGGSSGDRELRFGEESRFEEDALDGEGEVTATRSGGYGYRYTSRTTGELRLDYDGGESCELRLTFRGVGAGSYSYRCGGVLGGQGSFRLSGLNRGPEITSAGAYEVAENQTRVGQLEAVDQDKQDEITEYGIAGGADGGLFAVVEETGELQFREAPDYENPGDVASAEPESGAGGQRIHRGGRGEEWRGGEGAEGGEGDPGAGE